MCIAITYTHLILKHHTHFQDYKLIAEWLGDYEYIIPADRIENTDLGLLLLIWCKGSLRKAWELSLITTLFSVTTQRKIAIWIHKQLLLRQPTYDLDSSLTPADSLYMPAPESSNSIN